MMKAEILIGSPRKNGNTSFLAQTFNVLIGNNSDSANVSFLYDYEIKPCMDCRACKQDGLKCILKDNADILFEKIEKADLIVFGTPIYWFGPTAKMKLLIDRFRPYFSNKKLMGKKAIVILAAGSGKGDCDLTMEMFARTFEALGMALLGTITSKAYDAGDAEKDDDALANIESSAAAIARIKA